MFLKCSADKNKLCWSKILTKLNILNAIMPFILLFYSCGVCVCVCVVERKLAVDPLAVFLQRRLTGLPLKHFACPPGVALQKEIIF